MIFSRPATTRRPSEEGVAGEPQPVSLKTPVDGHYVALLRQPTLGGRVVLLLAVCLAIGPGGTWLFRVTQSLLAADGSDEQIGSDVEMPLTSGPSGKKRVGSQASAGSRAGGPAFHSWTDAPNWDLTQHAKDAWMVVERPRREGSVLQADGSSSLSQVETPLPVLEFAPNEEFLPHEDRLPSEARVRFLGDADELPIGLSETGSSGVSLFPPEADIELASDEQEIATPPRRNELIRTRDNLQEMDEEYFFDLETAPVAPSADSAPLSPVVVEALRESARKPEETPPAISDTSAYPTYVDVPAEAQVVGVPVEVPYEATSTTWLPPIAYGTCSRPVRGIHCDAESSGQDLRWKDSCLIPWEVFAQGEYIGPSRTPHVPEYRLRVDDQIEFVYRLTGEMSGEPYLINTGDTLRIESLTAPNLNREALVQPDGTISLTHLGQVPVAGRSIEEIRSDLETRYAAHVGNPAITVTPIKLNTVLEELRATVDSRFGNGGQSRLSRVTPEGTVQLVAIGSVPAHGLTLAELGAEIELRYAEIVSGLEVTPILYRRAPRYVFVLGEVRVPGRFTLEGPTTLMQAIAMAGGWNVGANLKQVVVFRRDESWRLMATKVSLRRPLRGKDPCPDGELWLRDSDIVVVPKSPILVADEFIDLVFKRRIYGVIPFSRNLSSVRNLNGMGSSVVPVP